MMNRKLFSLILVVNLALAMLANVCTTSKPSQLPDPEEVKSFLAQLVDVEKVAPGIVVGMIVADPDERWMVGYGRLSATDERVPDGDTVFEIGSVTKVFTGILLAQSVLKGEVQLDDPISLYLPEGVTTPEYEGKPITLLDLAAHTSGLPEWPSNFSSTDNTRYSDYTMDQMYDFLSGYHLTRAPGSTYEYSSYGFGLLGNLLVSRAGVADYDALLLERITHPLGMHSTRTELTSEMRSHLASPYSSYSVAASISDDPTFAGAGSIRSTANDMLTFLAANMDLTETELQTALQLASTPQHPGEWWTLAYIGLGWNLPGAGNGIIYHGGCTLGHSSYLAWDSERKIGVVVLINVYDGPRERIAFPLLRGFPLTPVPIDPSVLAAYAGRYQFDDFDVSIRVDGARIYFGVPGIGEAELIVISENRFYLANLYADITFYLNERGEVDRIEAVVIGGTLEAKKIRR